MHKLKIEVAQSYFRVIQKPTCLMRDPTMSPDVIFDTIINGTRVQIFNSGANIFVAWNGGIHVNLPRTQLFGKRAVFRDGILPINRLSKKNIEIINQAVDLYNKVTCTPKTRAFRVGVLKDNLKYLL